MDRRPPCGRGCVQRPALRLHVHRLPRRGVRLFEHRVSLRALHKLPVRELPVMNADMRGLRAEGCDFTASDFTRADLTDAILPGSVLTNCVFDWSWLVRTDLRSATLTGVRL